MVVLSCVRCNPKHDIGFLSHPNRVCVALSRARERLVLVGSSQTLVAKSKVWRALYVLATKTSGLLFSQNPAPTTTACSPPPQVNPRGGL